MTETLLAAAFVAAGVVWFSLAVAAGAGLMVLRRLPAPHAEGDVAVDVVVPARDEAERIEQTVRGLLAQEGVAGTVTVVDDGSTDATPAILARLAREAPRLAVIRVDEVPPGWLGKCHSCWVAAERSTAPWLLFVDADTWCRDPSVVRRAVAAAERDAADHLCLLPDLGPCTLGAQALVSLMALPMAVMALGVNRDLPFGSMGVGSFTLIRRTAYEAIGGHAALRLQVIEDFAMGGRVRAHGLRSRLCLGVGLVEVRWVHSIASAIQVVEKNMFAKVGFRVGVAVVHSSGAVAMLVLPVAGAILGVRAGWASGWWALAGMVSAVVPATVAARRYGWSPLAGLLAPWSIPALVWALLNSMRRVLAAGGVRWRGVLYPLAELRAAARGDPDCDGH